jgi:hypothetical protein
MSSPETKKKYIYEKERSALSPLREKYISLLVMYCELRVLYSCWFPSSPEKGTEKNSFPFGDESGRHEDFLMNHICFDEHTCIPRKRNEMIQTCVSSFRMFRRT